jgi:O-antigen/teichoic acid export membrane protein
MSEPSSPGPRVTTGNGVVPEAPATPRSRQTGIRSLLRSPLFRVALARATTFPITVVCGLLWLRLVIGHVSTADYALVAVVVGLQFLLSFLDFGTTAHVLESSGRYAVDREVAELGGALGRAWRTIVVGNVAVLLGALALSRGGVWGPVLGFPERSLSADLAVVLLLAVNVVARPLSLANSLVAGLGRPTVAQWSQVLASLISLAGAAVCVAVPLPLPVLSCTPLVGQLVASLVSMAVSMRTAPGLLRATVTGLLRRGGSGPAMRHVAAPMLFIQVVAPLNDQLDRVILSHLSTVEAVATFALAAQLFNSAQTVITSLLPTLWVEFAEQRVVGGDRAALARAFGYLRRFWLPAVALGVAFCIASWVLGPLASAGKLHLSWTLCVILGATLPFVVVHGILGVALTDPPGLRMQAALSALTTALNLGLSIGLAAPAGAVGPALASLLALAVHSVALAALAKRRLRSRPAEDSAAERPRPSGEAATRTGRAAP